MAERGIRARPVDTSAEIWALQMRRFASMTPGERLEIANLLSIECRELATGRAGIPG
jgi:hypothetical protein